MERKNRRDRPDARQLELPFAPLPRLLPVPDWALRRKRLKCEARIRALQELGRWWSTR